MLPLLSIHADAYSVQQISVIVAGSENEIMLGSYSTPSLPMHSWNPHDNKFPWFVIPNAYIEPQQNFTICNSFGIETFRNLVVQAIPPKSSSFGIPNCPSSFCP